MSAKSIVNFVVVLFLVSCSSSDPDAPSALNDDPDTVFLMVSGGECITGDIPTIVGEVDADGDFIPVDNPQSENTGAVDCMALSTANFNNAVVTTMNGTGEVSRAEQSHILNAAYFTEDTFIDDATPMSARSNGNLLLHDGETHVVKEADEFGGSKINYGMVNGSVALSVSFSALGRDGLQNRTYEISTEEVPAQTDSDIGNVASFVFFSVDRNNNGRFDADEFSIITEGQITWVGTKPNIMLTIEGLDEDGLAISGRYEGDFVDVGL